ncbi:MAG TPA: GH25 family lysozyme, partial [Polyangiaceae bacterium]|nr:GH25 family lysozyme [Polyangiaceae bacterium]
MRFGTWERRVTLAAAAVGLTACASRASDGDAQSSEAVTVCAGTTVEGIDVSEFQGNINWNSVKASGRSFAFIRASDGTGHLDPTFAGNWGAARSAGLLRSVYQFFRPTEDANAQADLVLQKLAADGAGELPPMLDVEVTDGAS